jgi:hypothetical protein
MTPPRSAFGLPPKPGGAGSRRPGEPGPNAAGLSDDLAPLRTSGWATRLGLPRRRRGRRADPARETWRLAAAALSPRVLRPLAGGHTRSTLLGRTLPIPSCWRRWPTRRWPPRRRAWPPPWPRDAGRRPGAQRAGRHPGRRGRLVRDEPGRGRCGSSCTCSPTAASRWTWCSAPRPPATRPWCSPSTPVHGVRDRERRPASAAAGRARGQPARRTAARHQRPARRRQRAVRRPAAQAPPGTTWSGCRPAPGCRCC